MTSESGREEAMACERLGPLIFSLQLSEVFCLWLHALSRGIIINLETSN